VVCFQLAIPATAATNLPAEESAVVALPDITEIAVAEQKPKLYILDRHNEI
jgi:hypothetical protein